MITLITYDITCPKRLRRIHQFLKNYGLAAQKSVFECPIDDAALKSIRSWCAAELDLDEDSVRIYKVCRRCMDKVVIIGLGVKRTQFDYQVL